jgi:putative transposase
VIHTQKATAPAVRVSVARMCDLLGVSRSGYYDWSTRQQGRPGLRAQRLLELAGKVVAEHAASDGVYGAPRITAELRGQGVVVSRKTVAKIMRRNGIQGVSPRPWTPVTTIPDTATHQVPDLVERRFDRGALNVVWTSDITYLRTGQGWLYLCAVRDGCSRRVVGYAFSQSLHTDLVEAAVRHAATFREGDTSGVILHADRGCQYTSAQLAQRTKETAPPYRRGRSCGG